MRLGDRVFAGDFSQLQPSPGAGMVPRLGDGTNRPRSNRTAPTVMVAYVGPSVSWLLKGPSRETLSGASPDP